MKFKQLFFAAFGAVLLQACAHNPGMGVLSVQTPPAVIVHINATGDTSYTTQASGKCKIANQGKNGCVHIDSNNTGLITFRKAGAANWVLTTFQICKVTAGANDCNLNIWERFEFAVANVDGSNGTLPDGSGEVDLTNLNIPTTGPNKDSFILLDQNRFQQEYYYQIKLCDGATCEWADPPLENGGVINH